MQITIIGLGLIGGSLGQAFKKLGLADTVVGVPRREETIDEALEVGAINEGTLDIAEGVRNADIVFICTPINLIILKLEEIIGHLKPGAIVTDIGSTKELIVKKAEAIMPEGTFFVGGHPMAGKEKTGVKESGPDLFKDRAYILVPTKKGGKRQINKLEKLLSSLGGKIMVMKSKKHDKVVAGISHLPLAVASALVNTIADIGADQEEMKQTASSGFRDTTRVASGDPVLGKDMFVTNQKAVLKMLSAFKKQISKMQKTIKEGTAETISAELKKAKDFRDSIYG